MEISRNYSLIEAILLLAIWAAGLRAQEPVRDLGINDSTTYALNADTLIVAGKTQLYFSVNGTLIPIKNFATNDPETFIKDFDLVSDTSWYLIMGSRIIGTSAVLYHSNNKGQSWEEDTSYFAATRPAAAQTKINSHDAINQLQSLSPDTLLLFVDYYASGVFYSVDAGQSWQIWFNNIPAHYHGILKCDANYYLYSLEGDGFPAYMFAFADSLLLSPDTAGVWLYGGAYHKSCYQAGVADCIYSNSASRFAQSLDFVNYVDSLCQLSVGIPESKDIAQWSVYPNPTCQFLNIEGSIEDVLVMRIRHMSGKLALERRSSKQIDIAELPRGMYFLELQGKEGYSHRLITKQ